MKNLIKSVALASIIGVSALPVLSMASTLHIQYLPGDLGCVATSYSVGSTCMGQGGQQVNGIAATTTATLSFIGRLNPLTLYGASNQSLNIVASALTDGGPITLSVSSVGNSFGVSTNIAGPYTSSLDTLRVQDGSTLYVQTKSTSAKSKN